MKKHMNIPMNLSLLRCILAGATCLLTGFPALANVPLILNYQGRLTVEALPANGAAAFKFALSDAGTQASQVATGSVTVDSGKVVGVELLTPGAGYLTPPEVTILDAAGEGSGAGLRIVFQGIPSAMRSSASRCIARAASSGVRSPVNTRR